MLKEKDLDIVLIATPDHWHALPMIAAVEAGADVYVQKPISVDVVEGKAMVAAARKHKRVVQVGTQRRSTPHLIEARDTIVKEGKLGKIGLVEIYCYYHMRATREPAGRRSRRRTSTTRCGPARRRCGPTTSWSIRASWRAFMEYGNGIVGDMCIHMLDMVRWMLDLGWPKRSRSTGGILVDKDSKANITDTQTATFDFGDLTVVWQHRTWGDAPDPKYPWGATFYGDKGTLKASVISYDFIAVRRQGEPVHKDVTYEFDKYPEDKTEKDLEKHVAPAIRGHMKDFLAAIAERGKPVADIEQGHISTASCILANLSMKLGRSLAWDAGASSRSSATKRRTGCSGATIGGRGCIRESDGSWRTRTGTWWWSAPAPPGCWRPSARPRRGRRVLLLEKNRRPGVKILMSGGTRCNITHATDNRGIVAAYGPPGRFLALRPRRPRRAGYASTCSRPKASPSKSRRRARSFPSATRPRTCSTPCSAGCTAAERRWPWKNPSAIFNRTPPALS